MAQPSVADVHVDAPLTDFALGYFQSDDKYISRRVAPIVRVAKQSDKYNIFTKAELLRTDAQKRAPGTKAPRRNWALSRGSYFADVYAIAFPVSEQVRANQDPGVDVEERGTRTCVQDIVTKMEVDWASTLFTTGVWDTDKTGGTDFTKWSDPTATPIEDLARGIQTTAKAGFKANTLTLGFETWWGDGTNPGLVNHPDLVARLPDNAPRIVTAGLLAAALELDNVFVASSVRNTAAEGLTASYSFNLADNALLAYVDPTADGNTPTAMATFMWTGLVGNADGVRTKRIMLPEEDALPLIEVDAAWDHKATDTSLGYFFTDCV
jgi:hypothetical protein